MNPHVIFRLGALAFLGVVTTANASMGTDNLGNVTIGTDDFFAFGSTKPPASFMDVINFDLKSANAVVTDAFTPLGVKKLDVSLFDDTTMSYVYQCTSGCADSDTFSGLTKGNKYSLILSGDTTGKKGSSSFISGTLSVSAVPEPATWISSLLGLGLLGVYLQRRRGKILTRTAV